MKPLIKWVGGKTQIIDILINEYPKKMNNYHDIFLGGGSTLIKLIEKINENEIELQGNIYAYDINEILINTYKNIQKYPDKLYEKIEQLINEFNDCKGEVINRKVEDKEEAMKSKENYYYWIRRNFNLLEETKSIKCSAMFIFLNKTCFRGLYRVGKNGFNVPYGHYKNSKIIDKTTILKFSILIKNVIFSCLDFTKSMLKIEKNDFVYLDPPYVQEKETSFVNYNINGFNIKQHEKLFSLCNELKEKNIKFILSNSNVKLVNDYFQDTKYKKKIIKCRRAIHSKNPAKTTDEVIIKSY